MQKLEFELPDQWLYQINLDVRISDINYGGHMGNDAFLRIAHESRLLFLKEYGFSEIDVGGCGLIMSDATLRFQNEAFHGDRLLVQLGINAFTRTSLDMVYCITRAETPIALLKTRLVFFNYASRKISRMPDQFRSAILDKR